MIAITEVAAPSTRLTYEEYRALPEDGRRYELVEGKVVVFATPTIMHQLLSGELFARFREVVMLGGLGWVVQTPVEVKFVGASAVQPDLVVVLTRHADRLADDRVNGAPDLIVEILSPSTRQYDLHTKAVLYAKYGVPEYWAVDPLAMEFIVHELRGGAYVSRRERAIVRSRVIPELAVDVPSLFAAVLRP